MIGWDRIGRKRARMRIRNGMKRREVQYEFEDRREEQEEVKRVGYRREENCKKLMEEG
jgi:hypothetical protein